jgi:hypothetical protein
MPKKIIGIIIIVFALLLFVGIIYGFFINPDFFSDLFNKEKEQVLIQDNNIPAKKTENELNPIKEVKKIKIVNEKKIIESKEDEPKTAVSSPRSAKDDLILMSSSFAERFGSYSNQSDYSNLRNLIIFMSDKMKNWAENFIEKARISKGPTDVYYGITTKAVKEEILKYDEDLEKAEILVNTRRKEAKASSDNYSDTFSQNITISFIKENGVWKVDSANWE